MYEVNNHVENILEYILTYYSLLILERVAEASQIDPSIDQNYLAMRITADVTGGKPNAV
jgi:hypothetical protein